MKGIYFIGFEEFTNATHLKECTNYATAKETLTQFLEILYNKEKQQLLNSCPVPCEQTTFVTRVTKYHKNSYLVAAEEAPDDGNSTVFLSIGYETLNTELHFETLIYDIGNFLTQIGGNLGLFLGISCLSVLTGLVELIHKVSLQSVRRFRQPNDHKMMA